jgi:transcriptional regulator with XRE-family HTH domain
MAMNSIAARIYKARTLASLSQTELARRIGVQRSAATQWESARGTTPSVKHLSQISLQTGVYFEWLATGRGPIVPTDGELTTAVILSDYAHDQMESRALELIRRLPAKKRQVACSILELLL